MSKIDNSPKARAARLYEKMLPVTECLTDADVPITQNYLETYCWLCAQVDELQALVDDEGTLVMRMVGNNKFQREELVEHPAIPTIIKLTTQKTAYYGKLHKVLSAAVGEEEDELAAFLKG